MTNPSPPSPLNSQLTTHNSLPSRGQSIIEIIIALAMMVLVLLALVWISIVAVRNANFSKNQALASQYSQELLEWLRSERDDDWTAFVSRAGAAGAPTSYCFQNLSWPGSGACSSGQTVGAIFLRQGSLEQVVAGRVQVVITTTWQDASGPHQSALTSYLTNWKNQ